MSDLGKHTSGYASVCKSIQIESRGRNQWIHFVPDVAPAVPGTAKLHNRPIFMEKLSAKGVRKVKTEMRRILLHQEQAPWLEERKNKLYDVP